ncbi:DUF2303 family protein [Nocardia sp. NPDC057030]|uniref:DUF2303 family protein n=1 Tax=unclassified Nocardia TaxID=2637762 RepID=UPI00363C0984
MTDLHEVSTEAAAISEIARDTQRYGVAIAPDGEKLRLHANVLGGDEHIDVAAYERYYPVPWRMRGQITVDDVPSLVALLEAEEDLGRVVIIADQQNSRITAILNFEGWRDHRILLDLTASEQYIRWANYDGKMVNQVDFAELIEERVADIVAPSAADMLELTRTFNATTNVEFDSDVLRQSGAVRFRYVERIEARAGQARDLAVPEKFTIRVPVWRGGEAVEMQASLRYRVSRGGLVLGYKLDQREDIYRAAFDGVRAALVKALPADADKYAVVSGRAPYAIDPMK